jgi:hypothetical protein
MCTDLREIPYHSGHGIVGVGLMMSQFDTLIARATNPSLVYICTCTLASKSCTLASTKAIVVVNAGGKF